MINWNLIAKYIAGQASEEESQSVKKWIEESPSNSNLLERLKDFYHHDTIPAATNLDKFKLEDWPKILQQIAHQTPQQKIIPLFAKTWLRVAAAILVIAACGSIFWLSEETIFSTYTATIKSPVDPSREIVLSDGTKVWLNKNSILKVARHYGEKDRMVELQGEGFFQVTKNPASPFIVSCRAVNTRVLGTAFNINAYDSISTITVTVAEGKVSVFEPDQQEAGKVVLPDQVVFYKPENGLVQEQNKNLNFQTWRTGIIRFQAEPLEKVCTFLSTYYRKDIRIENESLKNYTITTTLDHTNVNDAVKIIALTLSLKIKEESSITYFYQ